MLALLAVLCWALVPQGTMAAAGPDGVHLIICSTDGPVTMVIGADGTARPASSDGMPDAPMGKSHCPCVAGLTAAALPTPALWPPILFAGVEDVALPRALPPHASAERLRPESRGPPILS